MSILKIKVGSFYAHIELYRDDFFEKCFLQVAVALTASKNAIEFLELDKTWQIQGIIE